MAFAHTRTSTRAHSHTLVYTRTLHPQAAILEESGEDITSGGSYFPSLEFCEARNIPVMFTLQKAGDVIVLDGAVFLHVLLSSLLSVLLPAHFLRG